MIHRKKTQSYVLVDCQITFVIEFFYLSVRIHFDIVQYIDPVHPDTYVNPHISDEDHYEMLRTH